MTREGKLKRFLGPFVLIACLACVIRLGHATSPKRCYTIHRYSLALQSVTEDSVALEDLSAYENLTFTIETGPPGIFNLVVEDSVLQGRSDQTFQLSQ